MVVKELYSLSGVVGLVRVEFCKSLSLILVLQLSFDIFDFNLLGRNYIVEKRLPLNYYSFYIGE
jgi:hypothetical protein